MASLRFFSFFLSVGFLLSILSLTLSSPLIASVRLSCNSFLIFFPYIVGINTGEGRVCTLEGAKPQGLFYQAA